MKRFEVASFFSLFFFFSNKERFSLAFFYFWLGNGYRTPSWHLLQISILNLWVVAACQIEHRRLWLDIGWYAGLTGPFKCQLSSKMADRKVTGAMFHNISFHFWKTKKKTHTHNFIFQLPRPLRIPKLMCFSIIWKINGKKRPENKSRGQLLGFNLFFFFIFCFLLLF